jgi:V/A-type H+-transporting ATPase subunit A
MLGNWYKENLDVDVLELRAKMIRILHEENKLQEIVQLVGEDVLPDDQRLVLEISRVLRIGFLQQNAFHKEDTFVPLKKQYEMLKCIELLYDKAYEAIKKGIPISQVKDEKLFGEITKMKYTVPNDDLSVIKEIRDSIIKYYDSLIEEYSL